MKTKIYNLIILSILSVVFSKSYAQCNLTGGSTSTLDTYLSTRGYAWGTMPDSIDNLPRANENQLYNTTIEVKWPLTSTDIDPSYPTVSLNYIKIISVNGLPPGITFSNPSSTTDNVFCDGTGPNALNCDWPGGSYGCIKLEGTPTSYGSYPLGIVLEAGHFGGPTQLTYTGLELIVDSASTNNSIFFSAYVEGTDNNKALELYNPTSQPVDLSNYQLIRYQNGASTIDSSMLVSLSGTIAPLGKYLIVLDQRPPSPMPVDSILIAKADTFICPNYSVNSMMYFNGNDAIALLKNGVPEDIIGKVGEDPALANAATTSDPNYGWPVGASIAWTKDHTLIRKNTVTQGVTSNPAIFAPSIEWDSLPNDDFTMLFGSSQNNVHFFDTVTACGSYTSVIGNVYNTSGNYVDTLNTATVDSIYHTNLTIVQGDAYFFFHQDTAGIVTLVDSSYGTNHSYKWSWGDGNSDSAITNPSHTYATDGSYEVCLELIDTINGCSFIYCDSLTVDSNGFLRSSFTLNVQSYNDFASTTSIEGIEITTPTTSLYPNPANELLWIEASEKMNRIDLYNANGKLIKSSTLNSNKTNLSINNYENGIYFVRVYTKYGQVNKRLIIQK